MAISGSFGVASTIIPSTAVADDNSGKGPNIQANDRVVIKFSGSTTPPVPAIDATNINTILPVAGKTWLDGNLAIVSAVWSQTTVANDTLTITLSGPATYTATTPAKPTVVVGDTVTINGTITDSTGKPIVNSIVISGSFGVASTITPSSAVADDNSGKGPNIQLGDKVVIKFNGSTTPPVPAIDATNINTILPVAGKTWLDGNGAIVSAVWSQTTVANDTLTITLNGPATYLDTTPARPTILVGDTILVDGTITDSSGKAIISTVPISGSFGVASTITLSSAVADDNSGKGPNIQANDRVVITFSGATNAPVINAGNINTILPVTGFETFTGNNGSAPNSSYWTVFGSGTANIQNNSLYVAGTTTSTTGVSSQNKITLSGDFDIQVDFSNFAISTGGGALTFTVNAGTYVVQIERRGGTW